MPQEFGRFHYPDFFEFSGASAFCKDCGNEAEKAPLRGSFKLNTASSETAIPAVEGDLINQCGEHHSHNKVYEGPEHNVFRIDIGGRVIGETNPIPSIATGIIYFNLSDKELMKQFIEKQQELTRAFRTYWRI